MPMKGADETLTDRRMSLDYGTMACAVMTLR